MDARKLGFPDGTFDAIFSLSSIEHFGGPADIATAAREMGRVLKPGGHAFIVTECLTSFHPLDVPLVQTAIRALTLGRHWPTATPRRRIVDAFTARELGSRIVRPSGLKLMQELDTAVSPESYENTTRFVDGLLEHPSGSRFPHIMLQAHGAPWTSACLALYKPAAS